MDVRRVTVLVIDRDEGRKEIAHALTHAEFVVMETSSIDVGLNHAFSQPIDLIIVREGMPPPVQKKELIPCIRRITDVPIVVIGANASAEHILHAVDEGADLYLDFPMDSREFLARIYAQVRRYLIQRQFPP